MPTIAPCLWFDGRAEEAAELYCSVFPDSRIVSTQTVGEDAPIPDLPPSRVLVVDLELDGQRITALNGGPMFTFSEATSLQILCADQAEVDHYWDGLSADGGKPGACGWLKDRFGFSWQVVPLPLLALSSTGTPAQVAAVNQAVMGMQKLVIADLEQAWNDAA